MTEKQEKIYDYLASMYLDPNLELKFVNTTEYNTQDLRASVVKSNGVVSLILPYIYEEKDLNIWEDALITADKMLQSLKKEEQHDCNHPDFITAVRARLSLLKKYKNK